jgi:hypothetical protein
LTITGTVKKDRPQKNPAALERSPGRILRPAAMPGGLIRAAY